MQAANPQRASELQPSSLYPSREQHMGQQGFVPGYAHVGLFLYGLLSGKKDRQPCLAFP